jgi:DNA-directed RNA polymerase III subunit RPC1
MQYSCALLVYVQALEDLYVHYDNTVRNAAGGIVQFTYGDDGMDPVTMEGGSGAPLDLNKTLAKVGKGRQDVFCPCR